MLKAGLIGLGVMGPGHYFPYRGMDNVELVAVCDERYDLIKEKLTNFQSDTPLYADMEEMIKECRPDFIDIVTPTFTHADLAIKAMEAGCDVLCEKPMSLFPEDCERMIEASKRTGRPALKAGAERLTSPVKSVSSPSFPAK